jgi:hypothetical protein
MSTAVGFVWLMVVAFHSSKYELTFLLFKNGNRSFLKTACKVQFFSELHMTHNKSHKKVGNWYDSMNTCSISEI